MSTIEPDRNIKRFKFETNEGRVELDLDYIGMLEEYSVTGTVLGRRVRQNFKSAAEAYAFYNFHFVDAKTEAATLLVKATGAHV